MTRDTSPRGSEAPPRSLFFVLCLCLGLLWALPARGASPESATYSRDGSRIFWILHVSDTHIGAQIIFGIYNEMERFEWLMTEGIQVISPTLVVMSGDLVDGSPGGVPGWGQDVGEWTDYRAVVDAAGMSTDFYLDLPGNHDGYGDEGLTHYLQYSLNGETFGKTTRAITLDLPFGQYLIYGAATSGEDGARFVDNAEWSAAELADLSLALATHPSSELILVFGHHPLTAPTNGSQAESLLLDNKAMYFHGHTHTFESDLKNGVWTGQVDSLGKSRKNNVAVVAVDNNAVSYAATSTDSPWPFVVITAPADRRLTSGAESPYAYSVCQAGQTNPVRALVFDLNIVSAVTVSAAGGDPVAMTQDAQEPRLWHGEWNASGLTPGEITLTVTASGSETRSAEVKVLLEDVPCPGEGPFSDGGVSDGGTTDATTDASPDAGPRMDAFVFPDGRLAPGPDGPAGGCRCDAGDTGKDVGLGILGLLGFLGFLGLLRLSRRRNASPTR